MPLPGREYVTVSPPTLEKAQFPDLDKALARERAPYAREWLMTAFGHGLQIRMLRPPFEGYVMFQPGRCAWRPVMDAEQAVIVQDLRVAEGLLKTEARARLWTAVEDYTQYYGYALMLAVLGEEEGLIEPTMAPRTGWVTLDHGPGGARLIGKILHGPCATPSFPSDWRAREAAVGSGVVIQTTGECAALEARALRLCQEARAAGLTARHVPLTVPEAVQGRAVRPGARYAVMNDGVRIGGPEVCLDDLMALSGKPVA